MVKKPTPGERSGPAEEPFADKDFEKCYPNLTAHLRDARYEDRTSRVTSTILIFCENGVLRMCVNDRDNNRSVFFTAATVEEAFMKAEDAIATNTAEWKARQGYARREDKPPF